MVGMSGLGRRYPHQLSGGQQQRVALARALAVRPRLVLLDEPFSSLDASLRASVRADVRRVLRQAGTTAVLVTHDQDEALSWADHVAIIRDGRIGQFDTPHDLYGRPVDPDLARFLGDANLLAGVADGRSVRTVMGVLPIADGTPVPAPGEAMVVLVRPEQVELIAEPRGAYLTGEVVDYEYFGHDAVVRVRPDRGGGRHAWSASRRPDAAGSGAARRPAPGDAGRRSGDRRRGVGPRPPGRAHDAGSRSSLAGPEDHVRVTTPVSSGRVQSVPSERGRRAAMAEHVMAGDDGGFRGPQVCALVGITYRQLDYWARTGLLRPSLAEARGSGTKRVYAYSDVLELKVIKQLLDAGRLAAVGPPGGRLPARGSRGRPGRGQPRTDRDPVGAGQVERRDRRPAGRRPGRVQHRADGRRRRRARRGDRRARLGSAPAATEPRPVPATAGERPGSDGRPGRGGRPPVGGAGRPGAVRPPVGAAVRGVARRQRDPLGVRAGRVRAPLGRRRLAAGRVPPGLLAARPSVLPRADDGRPAARHEEERQGPTAPRAVPGGRGRSSSTSATSWPSSSTTGSIRPPCRPPKLSSWTGLTATTDPRCTPPTSPSGPSWSRSAAGRCRWPTRRHRRRAPGLPDRGGRLRRQPPRHRPGRGAEPRSSACSGR